MITQTEIQEFQKLRQKIHEFINMDSSSAKSCEGRMSIIFPDYWEEKYSSDKEIWGIELNSYLLVPNGDCAIWKSKTLTEAIHKADQDITQWIQEELDELEAYEKINK